MEKHIKNLVEKNNTLHNMIKEVNVDFTKFDALEREFVNELAHFLKGTQWHVHHDGRNRVFLHGAAHNENKPVTEELLHKIALEKREHEFKSNIN